MSWHNHTSVCFLFQPASQFMLFTPLSQWCSDLASLVFVLLCVVMVSGFVFMLLPFLSPAATRSLAGRFAAICKRTSGYEHICSSPQQHLEYICIIFLIFKILERSSIWLCDAELSAMLKKSRARILSSFLPLPARTHPESCLNARSHTHTQRHSFLSRLSSLM